MKSITWSIKDIVEILKTRQKNQFDGNIAVCGDRGNGKSTVLNKIFYRFDVYDPWTHQVYARDDIIKLLMSQQYGLCFDDEAINSGYKRDFQNKGQQELIKILTAYRDNYNIYGSAVPNFFSLDKDLRELYFLLLHVVERGTAVVHMPLQGRMYTQDRWDAKNNSRVEERWSKKIKKDPNFRIPYHELSTFRGYLFFEDVTENQEKLYKEIKKTKRAISFGQAQEAKKEEKPSVLERLYTQLIDNKLTREGLQEICILEDLAWSRITEDLNRLLRDRNVGKTLKDFLKKKSVRDLHSKVSDQINSIIPTIEP